VRNRLAVLVVVAFAAFGVLAGTASAEGGSGSGLTCTHIVSYGSGSFTCTGADGKTLSCTATWSWRPFGFSITCKLPDGSTKAFTWPR
jgi:hypothetical protein